MRLAFIVIFFCKKAMEGRGGGGGGELSSKKTKVLVPARGGRGDVSSFLDSSVPHTGHGIFFVWKKGENQGRRAEVHVGGICVYRLSSHWGRGSKNGGREEGRATPPKKIARCLRFQQVIQCCTGTKSRMTRQNAWNMNRRKRGKGFLDIGSKSATS